MFRQNTTLRAKEVTEYCKSKAFIDVSKSMDAFSCFSANT